MSSPQEKAAFTRWLRSTLHQFAYKSLEHPTVFKPIHGATTLVRQFHLPHPGDPVSTQAVHKWLNGQAIPKAAKLKTRAGVRGQSTWTA